MQKILAGLPDVAAVDRREFFPGRKDAVIQVPTCHIRLVALVTSLAVKDQRHHVAWRKWVEQPRPCS